MTGQKEFQFDFEFVEPVEAIMAAARKLVNSPDENRRSVAKAVLDVTAAGHTIKDALVQNRDADLAPYFDFWFADAITCAEKLLDSDNQDARLLAECLVAMEKATIKSKESFLAEMKRLGVRPSAQ